MATRQYIGARYVPKFYQNSVDGSTTWQSNVVYEPLTYVTLPNSHMYISKKQVPATVGTPAENVDYWLDVGSYNGIIEELQDQIDDLKEPVELMTHKRIIFCGDSYGKVTDSWVDYVVSILGLASGDYYNGCKIGAGFGRYSTNEFLNGLMAIENDVVNPETITDIILVGGINDTDDTYDSARIIANIGNYVSYCKTQYPNANLRLGFAGYMAYNSPLIGDPGSTQDPYRIPRVVQDYQKCGRYGMHYIAGMENVLKSRSYIGSDGLHPNSTGGLAIATAVVNSLLGIAVDTEICLNAPNVTITPYHSGWTLTEPTTLTDYTQHNDVVQMTFKYLNIGLGNDGYTLASGPNIVPLIAITGLPSDEWNKDFLINGVMSAFVRTADGFQNIAIPCFIKGGVLYGMIELVDSAGYINTIYSIKSSYFTLIGASIYA